MHIHTNQPVRLKTPRRVWIYNDDNNIFRTIVCNRLESIPPINGG